MVEITVPQPDLTETHMNRRAVLVGAILVLGLVLAVSVVVLAGRGSGDDEATESTETSATVGSAMAGPAVDIQITEEALASEPDGMDLSDPESAVRSYLDWTSYAYRIAQSAVALPTMSSNQEVHVDAYVQYNIQKGRLIDQKLKSITFGKPIEDAERVRIPVKETWTYSYISITKPGELISGPYEVSYDTTYTVVPVGDDWVVDDIQSKALGPVE